jgi:Tat protein secretion system quality control protein TatD with DNase activity
VIKMDEGIEEEPEDETSIWKIGVFDAHCHPTDIMASIKEIATMNARVLTVMASRSQDQELIVDTAKSYPLDTSIGLDELSSRYVVPAFGWHPWFSHQIYDDRDPNKNSDPKEHYLAVLSPAPDDDQFLKSLPDPIPLSEYLNETQRRLQQFPFALVGEVGLDRAFRLPYGEFKPIGDLAAAKTRGSTEEYTPGSREGRPLSLHRVSLEHQKTILRAQFELAGKMQRPVSVHSVQTHGVIFDLLQSMWKGHERPSKRARKRGQSASGAHANEDNQEAQNKADSPLPFPPRICMHSYSGPADALKQFLAPSVPADIYFSFSSLINFSTVSKEKATNAIRTVPDDRILIESDFHCAGERMDELLKEIILKVCEIKGWGLKRGAQQLKENWMRFVFG